MWGMLPCGARQTSRHWRGLSGSCSWLLSRPALCLPVSLTADPHVSMFYLLWLFYIHFFFSEWQVRSSCSRNFPIRTLFLYSSSVVLKKSAVGRRDGSVVRSTACTSKGPGFDSQDSHGSSQLFVIPVPRALTLSLSFVGARHARGADMQSEHLNT